MSLGRMTHHLMVVLELLEDKWTHGDRHRARTRLHILLALSLIRKAHHMLVLTIHESDSGSDSPLP